MREEREKAESLTAHLLFELRSATVTPEMDHLQFPPKCPEQLGVVLDRVTRAVLPELVRVLTFRAP